MIKSLKKYLFTALLALVLLNFTEVKSQNISTIGEVYDFEVGDIFHMRYTVSNTSGGEESIKNIEIIDKYYSLNDDSLFYVRNIAYKEHSAYNPIWTYDYYIDTIVIVSLDSLINSGNIDSVYNDSALYNGRTINYRENHFYDFMTYDKYVNGCGVAYSYFEQFPIENPSSAVVIDELVYYKKGDEEWGSQLIVSNETIELTQMLISIYPNPTNGKTTIQTETLEKIEIFDIKGELLLSSDANKKQIDLSSFSKGIYFIKVTTPNNGYSIKKILLE